MQTFTGVHRKFTVHNMMRETGKVQQILIRDFRIDWRSEGPEMNAHNLRRILQVDALFLRGWLLPYAASIRGHHHELLILLGMYREL